MSLNEYNYATTNWIGVKAMFSMGKPIVFTERVLETIWGCFQASKRLMDTPHAPTKQAFLAQYAQLNLTPTFSWNDPVHGVVYQYDLRINQVQITPVLRPYARAVAQLNRRLDEVLPADLLTTDDNWKTAWFRAARSLDIASMRFIIEQGGCRSARCGLFYGLRAGSNALWRESGGR